MKKILTVLLFVAGFGFTATAQETTAATASAAPKASCCATGAKVATADKSSCSASTAAAGTQTATAPNTMVAQSGAAPAPATTEKKACKTGASCCAGEAKAEAKKVL